MSRLRGQITIFLSLTLLILISFLCTALRSAQSAGSRYLFSLAAEATTRSVFGVYDTAVWEQYRVLTMTDQGMAERIGEECIASYVQNGTLFPLEIDEIQITDGMTLTENGARGWEKAVVSYMEAKLPAEWVSQLMEQTGLLDGLDQIGEWMRSFLDVLKPLIRLEKSLCELEEKLSDAVDAYQRGKQLLEELVSVCETVELLLHTVEENGGAVGDVTVDPAIFQEAWSNLEQSYKKIQKYLQDSGWELTQLTEDAEKDLQELRILKEQLEELSTSLSEGGKETLSSLADLGGYLSGLLERYHFLEKLPVQLRQQVDYLRRISEMELPAMEEVLSGNVAKDTAVALLKGAAKDFLGEVWSPKRLEIQAATEADEENVEQLLRLQEWLDQGVLALVLKDPDQVSDAALGRILPRTQRSQDDGLWEEAYCSLLCGEYALRYTNIYGQKETAGLQYETEYLIAGNRTDRANLASVANRLLVVRGAMNFMYLLQNSDKREGLQVTAASISAALGGWVPEGLAAVLLMVVWAMAEAVCDVRTLLKGGRVSFWKEDATWNLGFSQLWTVLDDGFVIGQDQEEGMSYEEYLRLFLFMVSSEEKCYRIMEIAEENLRAVQEDFCIDKSWYHAVVTISGRAAGQPICVALEYGY